MVVDEARLLTAIVAMRDARARQHDDDRVTEQRTVDAIHAVAERVKASYDEELAQLHARIAACLLPVEPLRQAWNVFRLFDVEYDETRWTQWLAAVLRPESGERCSRVAWGAFCDAVSRRAVSQRPSGASNLADHVHWNRIAAEIPVIEDEVSDGDLGRLDLLFTTASIVAAVENKLWADWHDSTKGKQACRYREIANRRLTGDTQRRLGLILLSEREGLKPGDYPPDYIHVSWRDLGQALRRALERELSGDPNTVIELWPIVLTLVSIEQDLLGLRMTPSPTAHRNTALKELAELATYLEGG